VSLVGLPVLNIKTLHQDRELAQKLERKPCKKTKFISLLAAPYSLYWPLMLVHLAAENIPINWSHDSAHFAVGAETLGYSGNLPAASSASHSSISGQSMAQVPQSAMCR
jgi:hypothetical protein